MHALYISLTALVQRFQKIVVNEDFVLSDLLFTRLLFQNILYSLDVHLQNPGDLLLPLSAFIECFDGLPDGL